MTALDLTVYVERANKPLPPRSRTKHTHTFPQKGALATSQQADNLPSDFTGFQAAIRSAKPAIEGNGGNNTTYAACCLAADYNVPIEMAWPEVQQYNQRCLPPWDEAQLYKKLEDSYQSRNSPIGSKVRQASDEWYERLKFVLTADGRKYPKKNNLLNTIIFLENLPELKGKIRYNQFSKNVVITGELPWKKQ